MRVLNLHGYKGSAENSMHHALLRSMNMEVFSPQIDYDNIMPKTLLRILTDCYEEYSCQAVSGTSVGGFFALQICVLKKCPTIVVNPCLLPFVYLPRLGYKNEKGILQFTELLGNLTGLDKNLISSVIGEKDELIDTHDYTKAMLFNSRYITVPNGKHSGFTLPLDEIFSEHINDFLEIK